MANVMINQICNLKCPYCFACEFVNNIKNNKNTNHPSNINFENFIEAVDFISKSDNHIGLIGGEPTLHPKFKEILIHLINNKSISSCTLYTNGILLSNYLQLLSNYKFSMLINCNSPADVGQQQFNNMVKSLDSAHFEYFLNDKITLGINMYKPNFEYEYIIDLLKKYKKENVRTSIVVPNTSNKKNYNPLDYFKELKPSVFKFFRRLKQENIMPNFDCNMLPVCLMTESEKEELKEFYSLEKGCGKYCNLIDGSKCSPVIDILPNLDSVRCFGMSSFKKLNIRDFNNLIELNNTFKMSIDNISSSIYLSEECKNCSERLNLNCFGGCLAFKATKLNHLSQIIEQFNNMDK